MINVLLNKNKKMIQRMKDHSEGEPSDTFFRYLAFLKNYTYTTTGLFFKVQNSEVVPFRAVIS